MPTESPHVNRRSRPDMTSDLSSERTGSPDLAVLIPCFNEAVALPAVIADFREAFPDATVYVFDNNSTDGSIDVARRCGARVRKEPQQGKGNVVRRMFADVDADVYLLVDGDDTYSAKTGPAMVRMLLEQRLDMVVARRISADASSYRFGHQLGNRTFTSIVGWLFGSRVSDLLSGYRVLSRRFVKSFPALSTGFEIETELTVHALSLNIPLGEIPSEYSGRPAASESKLHTVRDGVRILLVILRLTKAEKPLLFFSAIFTALAVAAVILGVPLILEWLQTGLVTRLPTALLSASLMVTGFLGLTNGILLSSLARNQREIKRMHYVNLPWLGNRHVHRETEPAD